MRCSLGCKAAVLTAIAMMAFKCSCFASQPPVTNDALRKLTNSAPATPRIDGTSPPDLTLGFKPETSETYNLGPTGMRGWIYCKAGLTDLSRQILVTLVEKGSPADRILEAGDVILGVDGRDFAGDARIRFGLAIGEAEKAENKGILKMVVWHRGVKQTISLKLRVMGSYSDTAPYDCPKSKKILEEGCRYIAKKKEFGRFSVGALALLASGNDAYLELVKKEAHEVMPSDEAIMKLPHEEGMRCWGYAYNGIFLSEYCLATGDKSVLPGIRAYAGSRLGPK
ncbi:MAG: DUF6288 domain-containing protein, partial [bacterium]